MASQNHNPRDGNDLDIRRAGRKRKPEGELREHRTIRIKARVVRELERRARDDGRTFSDYSARILERHVDLAA